MSTSRTLAVAQILMRETDADHSLTLPQIQDRLAEQGISSERKALYRDLDALNAAGFTISRAHTRPVSYYLDNRLFTPTQLTLLVDAVQTSRSITKTNSAAIIRNLKRLVSVPQAKQLDARIHVAGRIKMQNESVFHTLDIIQRALAEKRDITFNYMRYDCKLRLHDVTAGDGKKRIKTPLFLVYSDDNYYLLVWDEKSKDNLRSYRVDRIRNVMILDKSPRAHKVAPDFNIADYERQAIGMFGGKPTRITLLVVEHLVGAVVDLFGADNLESRAATEQDGAPDDGQLWALMHAQATPTPVLFGKIAQFGSDVRIMGPASVKNAYRKHLEACLNEAN